MKAEGYFNAQYKAGDTDVSQQQACPCEADMCMPNMMGDMLPGVVCPPIYECPRETVCHRYICHEVPSFLLLITYIYIGEIDEFKINCTRFYCGSW